MGWVKAENQRRTYEALVPCFARPEPCGERAQATFTEKGHGRQTRWEVEVIRLSAAMRAYLAELGWPAPQVIGRYRVWQRHLGTGNEQQGERYWLAGAPWDLWEALERPAPKAWAAFWWQALRGHWRIENQSFHVLDESWREDRHTGRRIARGLHRLRVGAMMFLRAWGFRWMPTGQRHANARADALLDWLARGGLSPRFVNS